MKHLFVTVTLLLSVQLLQAQTLRQLAEAKNKFIGTAVNNEYLDGAHGANPSGYKEAVETEFNCVVAENAFKMGYLLPNKPADPFNFSINDFNATALQRVDALLTLADQQNMRVRGHAYIWYNQAPQWLKNDAPGWTDQQVYAFAERYITVLGTYTKGKVDEWDVVNEAINDDATTGYRTADTWYAGVSDIQDFIDHCFNIAKTVDPDADTYYNDYNIETKYHGKNAFMLSMVEGMKNRGVNIDGVGLQSHFISGADMNTYVVNEIGVTIDKLGLLGLEAVISELDLRICGGTDQAALEEQEAEFKEITEMFLTKDNCKSLLVWGVSDLGSWIPYTFSDCDDALLWDDNMNKKPAYNGLSEALAATDPVPGELSPYGGVAALVPGIVQVEEYDEGGDGVAFSDNDAANQGNSFRTDAIDIAGTGDMGGGYSLGWNEGGEWLKYTIDVSTAGYYDVSFRVASPLGGGIFSIEIDGVTVLAQQTVGVTGAGWEDYTDVSASSSVYLEEGEQVMTLTFTQGGFNFNYIEFTGSPVLGLSANASKNQVVYPNPTNGILNLSKGQGWILYSSEGKELSAGFGTVVDLSKHHNGFYFLNLGHEETVKVIKH